MVCAMAQWLEANTPYEIQANIRQAMDAVDPFTIVTVTIDVARLSPVITQNLRTLVGVAPLAMVRSASAPVMMVAMPVTRKARAPT